MITYKIKKYKQYFLFKRKWIKINSYNHFQPSNYFLFENMYFNKLVALKSRK